MTFSSDNPDQLLYLFNRRDNRAFGMVYRKLYRELYLYADKLFSSIDLQPEDAIQNIMTDIWKRHSVQFTSLEYIKTFCFIALKNAYKNHLRHKGHQQRYELENKIEQEFPTAIKQIEEYAALYEALLFLPSNNAIVIRMYLEGYKPEEIASTLNIALQTVYNRRREAILILKKHLIK